MNAIVIAVWVISALTFAALRELTHYHHPALRRKNKG